MKKYPNNSIITYYLFSLVLVLISQIIIHKYFILSEINYFLLQFAIFSILVVLSYIIYKKIAANETKYIEALKTEIEKLSESNERYDIVAKATSDTIWDWDLKTNKFIWNKGIKGIFGYTKKEVGNDLQWWFDKIHPEDSLKMSVKLYSFIAEKSEKWQDQYRFMCADGTYKYVNDRGFLVKDENDNVVRMIGAMQDITKQKEEEQRLKLLETVVTNAKDTIIITEEVEKEYGIPKIVYANPAFNTLTGYEPTELIGTNPALFMSKKSVRNDISKIVNALKKEEEFTFIAENTNKKGDNYWMNFSMIPIINTENKLSHWIAILRDITQEKEKEIELEKLIHELTQNNKDLKQFSYITSHNLRAPLSNLTGLLNLINDIPIEDEEVNEIISGFSKSTELLNETVNDLIKVIVIKDNQSINREAVNIKDSIENLMNQLHFMIIEKKPKFKMNINEAETVLINKSYLESIILNLMTNSLRYNNPNKELEIAITVSKDENTTLIKFEDNGIGIDLERNKDKIFGLYQRFHDYPDSKGLGLYLVKSQVESMGGSISVESQVNIGTTFTIIFKNQ